MSRSLNRTTIFAALLVLILGTFLPPLINVSRFRVRVADALSRALGRPVTVGEVHLRLFPWPGLDLQRVVVDDDPAYSAEPLLRADEVTAALRLTSLWRGRLEIARLSFSYPSLNLVRARNGHWNLESLLERARQIPTAPTGQRSAEARPRFPYVEASGGRINLKLGQEKTVYALSNADFALSLPSENVWQLNVTARPMRTDANLSDTGSVRISGTAQRASTLSDTPLNLRVVLQRAQLGQLTKLIYGRDRGWRGTVRLAATLQGTPASLAIAGDASVDDFRRYDIATRGSLRLAAHCSGVFSSSSQELTDLACRAPVGDGAIELHGAVAGLLPLRSYTLLVTAKDLPAASLVMLAQRMKKDLPQDLQAGGTVSTRVDVRDTGSGRTWSGTGMTSALQFTSESLSQPLDLGALELAWGAPPASRKRTDQPPPGTVVRIQPFPLDLGGGSPAKARAWFAGGGYNLELQGETRVNRLLEVAHAFGVPAPQETATGLARVDLDVGGAWTGFAAPVATGNLHLHSVTTTIPGIAAPLQLSTAALHLAPDALALYDMAGSFAGTHVSFTGSVQAPRPCVADSCTIAFQLRAGQLSTDELNRLVNPRAQKRPWYDILGQSPRPSVLGSVNAVGKFSAARLEVKTLAANHVSGDLRLSSGVLVVRNLHADLLGGSTAAELHADFTGADPAYTLKGTLHQVSMAALAAVARDAWATGKANAGFQVNASGWDAAQLRDSATGSLKLDWHDGSLPSFALAGAPAPLKVRHFQGTLELVKGQVGFTTGRMETPAGIYQVSGTASLDRKLKLRLMRGKTEGYEVTGTMEKPRIAASVLPPTERAAVKP